MQAKNIRFRKAASYLTLLVRASMISLLSIAGNQSIALDAISPLEAPKDLDPRKVQLGKALFHDVRLSNKENISCANCHAIDKAGVDNLSFSPGTDGELTGRNTPTVFNSRFNIAQFWDGRANTLQEQIDAVVNNPLEMGGDWPSLVERLGKDADFVSRVEAIYGSTINKEILIDALAQYMSALVTVDSPFDQYLRGDHSAISERAKDGYAIFNRIGCISCHQGQNIGGNLYQKAGVKISDTAEESGYSVFGNDMGRYEVSGRERDKRVFRVPSLRNISQTAPYFHNAQAVDLDSAILIMARLQLGKELQMNQVQLIKEFLYTLNGELPEELK